MDEKNIWKDAPRLWYVVPRNSPYRLTISSVISTKLLSHPFVGLCGTINEWKVSQSDMPILRKLEEGDSLSSVSSQRPTMVEPEGQRKFWYLKSPEAWKMHRKWFFYSWVRNILNFFFFFFFQKSKYIGKGLLKITKMLTGKIKT